MMDQATLNLIAANAVALLTQYLSKTADTIVPKAVDHLFNAIKTRFEDKPAAKEAVADLEKTPKDPDAQAAMRVQLKKTLVEDASFAQEIRLLVEQLKEAGGESAVRASDRGVSAGRDISGTVLTGDIKGSVSIGEGKQVDE